MQHFVLEKDILVICVTASSFPEGIERAHQRLHSVLPPKEGKDRRFFGLSRPEGEKGIFTMLLRNNSFPERRKAAVWRRRFWKRVPG